MESQPVFQKVICQSESFDKYKIRVGRRIKDKNPIFENYKQIVSLTPSTEYGDLSPYVLKDKNGVLMENFWQFSKVYTFVPNSVQRYSRFDSSIIWEHKQEIHVDDKGFLTKEWFEWAKKGMKNKFAVRYPVGFYHRHKCIGSVPTKYLNSLFEEKEMPKIRVSDLIKYVDARHEIYFEKFSELVKDQSNFKKLVKMLQKGIPLLIIEIDGPHQESLDYYKKKYNIQDDFIQENSIDATSENLKIMLNDISHPFGHGYCLAMCLQNMYIKDSFFSEPDSVLEKEIMEISGNDWFTKSKEIKNSSSKTQIIGVCGREGSGKTTLAEILCGKQTCVDAVLKEKDSEAAIISILFGINPENPEYKEKSDLLLSIFKQFLDPNFKFNSKPLTLRIPYKLHSFVLNPNPLKFTQLGFADPLKLIICILFKLDFDIVNGTTELDRRIRETFEIPVHNGSKTIRQMLQYLGTDVFRNKLGDDIWIKIMERRLKKIQGNCIITDVRFDNEAQLIKDLDGILICMYRNKEDFSIKEDQHISSTNFIKWTTLEHNRINYYIENNSTIHKIKEKMDIILKHTNTRFTF
jgi:energy-coupling factor transporter ATP-binding protein EcfA2